MLQEIKLTTMGMKNTVFSKTAILSLFVPYIVNVA